VLDVVTHNAAECGAAGKSRRCPRGSVSPCPSIASANSGEQTRTQYNVEVLLQGPSTEAIELPKRVTRVVDEHAGKHFDVLRAHAAAVVLEVRPGCGYLAMLLGGLELIGAGQ
jgi:hypothetical protein